MARCARWRLPLNVRKKNREHRYPDPTAVEGADTEKWIAFRATFEALENRIKIFISLPLASIDRMKLQKRIEEIGLMADA